MPNATSAVIDALDELLESISEGLVSDQTITKGYEALALAEKERLVLPDNLRIRASAKAETRMFDH